MKLAIISFITLVFSTYFQSQISIPVTNKKFLKPPPSMKYFTWGYNDLTSSLLWIRLVQNIDTCEEGKYSGSDYVAPQQNKDGVVTIKAVVERKLKPSKCHKGWVYSMLDVITEITPRFKIAYEHGAQFLSIIVDDREGARLIFEKGLKLYPNDWRLNFNAAYLFLWELQDSARAGELLRVAINNGGPPTVSTLAATIYKEEGRLQMAEITLREALAKDPPEEIKVIIRKKLEDLRK